MADGLVVVCGPDRAPALESIAGSHGLAGWVRVGRPVRTAIEAPRLGSLEEGLDQATAVAVLSPYRGLAGDLERCRRRGIPVVLAGPSTARADDPEYAPGRWRHTQTWASVDGLRRRPAFGRPVYLRQVTGGGAAGLPGAWWALLEAVECARDLLDGPMARLWVGAVTRNGRWHATATLVAGAGASAQLVVAPAPDPGEDLMLLGTGGLAHVDAASAAAVRRDAGGESRLPIPPAWPDARWITAGLAGQRHPSIDRRTRAALHAALRRAARSRTLEPVRL